MGVHTLISIPGFCNQTVCGGDMNTPDCMVPAGMIMRFWKHRKIEDTVEVQLLTGKTFWATMSIDEMTRRYQEAINLDSMKPLIQTPVHPRCSVCKDNPNECSKNYSGGWVGTRCPD